MRWSRVLLLLACAGLLAGCIDLQHLDNLDNRTDKFAYGATLTGFSGTKSWTWTITPTQNPDGSTASTSVAAVNWGVLNQKEGSVTVTVKDADGATVYAGTLRAGETTAHLSDGYDGRGASIYSKAGSAGAWSIEASFDGFTGSFGVSVQKKGVDYDTEPLDQLTTSAAPSSSA